MSNDLPRVFRSVLLLAVISTSVAKSQAPTVARFGEHLHAIIESYPTDGTHAYHWPKSGSWAGVTRDLDYRGQRVADGDPAGRCYCCGLTFEVFVRAWQGYCESERMPFVIPGIDDAKAMKRFRGQWFGADGNRRTMQNAIVGHGLGVAIDELDAARPGDFVQFWRSNGSGHAVVFVDWVRRGERIVGITYWSTQPATKGIGRHTEHFTGERGVDPAQIHIARVGRPAGQLRVADVNLPRLDGAEPAATTELWTSLRAVDADLLRVRGLPDDLVPTSVEHLPGYVTLLRSDAVPPTHVFVRSKRFDVTRNGIIDCSVDAAGESAAQWARLRDRDLDASRGREFVVCSVDGSGIVDAPESFRKLIDGLGNLKAPRCLALGELTAGLAESARGQLAHHELRCLPLDATDASLGALLLGPANELVSTADAARACAVHPVAVAGAMTRIVTFAVMPK